MNKNNIYIIIPLLLLSACSKSPYNSDGVNRYDIKKECSKEEINSCSQENKLYTIEKNPELFLVIKNPNTELELKAVQNDPNIIKHIQKPSKEVQIEALRQDPTLIEFIKNPHRDALKF
jgi:hypothetical protein